jgi:hypothetical protein
METARTGRRGTRPNHAKGPAKINDSKAWAADEGRCGRAAVSRRIICFSSLALRAAFQYLATLRVDLCGFSGVS